MIVITREILMILNSLIRISLTERLRQLFVYMTKSRHVRYSRLRMTTAQMFLFESRSYCNLFANLLISFIKKSNSFCNCH